ncbi:MAG: WD40 repeat domain-containing protein [Opitutaceae bacterium]|nr:WD40 repeat domain-containing protein [Opitutaceae bacterium]
MEAAKTPEDHARIAKTSSSEQRRLSAVEVLAAADNQALLADVAANAGDINTRAAAADKLTDERLLAGVAKTIEERRDWMVTARMGKITDPQLLASLAREARSMNVRVEAALRLGDQALLADIARSGADGGIRKKAIAQLADQPALAALALNDRDQSVRLEAVRRVSDQALLAGLILDEKAGQPVRIEAVSRLDDQRVLAAIAKTGDKDAAERRGIEPLRLKALERLTDQQALADIAKNIAREMSFESQHDDTRILRVALERIGDQAALADIATGAHPSACSAVLEKITDQEVLTRLFRNKQAAHMRDEIVKKLTDQKLLAEVAAGEDFEHVRMDALNRLTDPPALLDLARHTKSEGIALAAVKKLDNPQTLAALAADENANATARLWAVWRVADRELLAGIAKNAADGRVRGVAAEKLAGAAPGTAPRNITDLIKTGKLLAEISGDGIQEISVRLRKTVPWPLEVVIPAGTYFVCNNKNAQNMVSTEDVRVALAESESEKDSFSVPVACANRPKDVPDSGDRFTIGSLPNGEELAKLMASMRGKNVSYPVKQAAVWILTDNADYSDLGKLITRTSRMGEPSFLATSRRTIQEPEAVAAMRLCAGAGVDIKTKAIWKEARKLHAELPAGELRDWLQTFGGFTPPTHAGSIDSLLVTPDGKRLLTADNQGDAKLWSLPDGKLIKTLESGLSYCRYRHAVISPDGGRLITEEGVTFSFLDGKIVQKTGDENRIGWREKPVISPDGSLLAGFVRNDKNGDNLIKVFSFPERTLLATLDPGPGYTGHIAVSPDGKQLAAEGDGGLKFWSLPDGKLLKTLEKEYNSLISRDWKWRVFFRSEQKTPASGGKKVNHLAIDIHSPADGARVGTLAEYPGYRSPHTTLTPDGKHLLLVMEDTVRLLSIPDGAVLMTVENVWGRILSPDGKLLLTRGNDTRDTFTARRLPDGEILGSFKLPEDFCLSNAIISPDNTLLVAGDCLTAPGTVKLWSLPDGKLIKTLEGE